MDPYRKKQTDFVQVNGETKAITKYLGIGYDYYICKRGSRFGLRYKSLSADSGKIYPVDSLINDYLTTPSTVYNLKDAPQGVVESNGEDEIVEKIVSTQPKEFSPDTTYFYYKSKPIEIPFVNKSIKLGNKCLYKCNVIFNAIPAEKSSAGLHFKKRKWSFELQTAEVPEKEKILALIERFKKWEALNPKN
jgi:hypothetical protein